MPSLSTPQEPATVLEAIPHVVWMASPDGSLTYLNRRGTELIGVSAEQLSGWSWL